MRALSTGASEFYAINEGLSAQLAQSGHPERIRGDGSRLVGRECWNWDRIKAGVRTSEAS